MNLGSILGDSGSMPANEIQTRIRLKSSKLHLLPRMQTEIKDSCKSNLSQEVKENKLVEIGQTDDKGNYFFDINNNLPITNSTPEPCIEY